MECDQQCLKCLPAEMDEPYCIDGAGWKKTCKEFNVHGNATAGYTEKFVACGGKTESFIIFYVFMFLLSLLSILYVRHRSRENTRSNNQRIYSRIS